MIKRIFLLFLITTFIVLTLGWVSPAAAISSGRRPQRSGIFIQTVTEGEEVMWMDDSTITGVTVDLSSAKNFNISNTASPWDNDVLHAMRPPNSACLEGFIDHYRDSANVMHNEFVVVPWCNGQTNATYAVALSDAAWSAKYLAVRSYANWDFSNPVSYNDQTLVLRIEKTNAAQNCWQARLYNYTTGVYDLVGSPSSVCGVSNDNLPNDGWTSIEEHYKTNTSCTNLGTYHVMQSRATKVQHAIGGTYTDITVGLSFTIAPASRCQPAPWHIQTQTPFVGHPGAGIILCDPFLQPNCD